MISDTQFVYVWADSDRLIYSFESSESLLKIVPDQEKPKVEEFIDLSYSSDIFRLSDNALVVRQRLD